MNIMTFKQLSVNSVTILNNALAEEGAKQQVNCMIIDKRNLMLSHSDHSPILLEVNSGKKMESTDSLPEQKILSPDNRTVYRFKRELDSIRNGGRWEGLNPKEKCLFLQNALVEATERSCSGGNIRNSKDLLPPKWLRRLHTKSQCIESRLRQMTCEKLLHGFGSSESGRNKAARLQWLIKPAKSLRVGYSEASFNLNQKNVRKSKLSKAILSP